MPKSPDLDDIARRLGLNSPGDLILHLPLRYEDETRITRLRDARDGEPALFEGVVVHAEVQYRPRRQLVVQVEESGNSTNYDAGDNAVNRAANPSLIYLRFLNFYPSQIAQMKPGARLRMFGEIRPGFFGAEMVHPRYRVVKDGAALAEALTPVYPTVAGIGQATLQRAVNTVMATADLSDTLPPALLANMSLTDFKSALLSLHHPGPEITPASLDNRAHPAWQRLKFDELLAQQLSLRLHAEERQHHLAQPLTDAKKLGEKLRASLPFPLTRAQARVLDEIRHDLARAYPMHRLLQGDVGSGKTCVAALAALIAVGDGYQAAVMAPTEILAEQLYLKLHEWLEPLGIRVVWLAAALKIREKRAAREAIETGAAQVAVGTHALIQDDVVFLNLALAIVDEQHRFGVEQRLALRSKGSGAPLERNPLPPGEGRVREHPPQSTTSSKRYLPLPADILDFSRQLRAKQTDAEKLMWHLLRNRNLADAKFQRQKAFGPYFLDFYCHEAQLAIELDGSQHLDTISHDAIRDDFLASKGVRVLRFWNNDVLLNTEEVLEAIWIAIGRGDRKSIEVTSADVAPSPCPLPEGEGSNPSRIPHLLMMSATPIPRSLAMSYYADLDVSVIDELPPGRTPIATKVMPDGRREEVIERLRDYCQTGAQAYWVCPLVEESEKLDLKAALDTHAELTLLLPELRIGLAHGRLKGEEKAAVMAAFKAHELDLLVATTVIEVGVDVPNAGIMVIEHAERMGLAQLHQLRGRVGRGARESACILLYAAPLSETAKRRLKVIRESTDGFFIAREDLAMRGPGEFMGARQSGQPMLRFADLETDTDLLERARDLAENLLETDPATVSRHLARWLPRGMARLQA